LSGDRVVRREAARLGLSCLTAAQVVVLLKDQGLISEVRRVLDQMRQRGFGIDDPDYLHALKAAGETP
jgi:predicted nucleic acid-binding protein